MAIPDRIWSAVYRHDRRKHRHRCRCCNRIVNEGEQVIMMRVQRGSWLLHEDCADKPHPVGTWRGAFEAWAGQELPIISEPRKPVDSCPRFESCGMTLPEGLKPR